MIPQSGAQCGKCRALVRQKPLECVGEVALEDAERAHIQRLTTRCASKAASPALSMIWVTSFMVHKIKVLLNALPQDRPLPQQIEPGGPNKRRPFYRLLLADLQFFTINENIYDELGKRVKREMTQVTQVVRSLEKVKAVLQTKSQHIHFEMRCVSAEDQDMRFITLQLVIHGIIVERLHDVEEHDPLSKEGFGHLVPISVEARPLQPLMA